ncbi:MAG: hypothetical protein RBG13Loki_0844 [Promethearchaeota archaeon CR_4]|nr:MAG: hypothetical protein RBG13Loki_0844 [Candidatus Lokiarchaeota archaeon CR_4]
MMLVTRDNQINMSVLEDWDHFCNDIWLGPKVPRGINLAVGHHYCPVC